MDGVKEILRSIRDGMAYVFSWLVICSVALSLMGGNKEISVTYLVKLFILCLWGVVSFIICFKSRKIQKKGFIFSLSLFYILFIPAEIFMFYAMGIFKGRGNAVSWIVFGVIIIAAYLISLLIDHFVMKRNAEVYTQKMLDYAAKNRQ
jgi:predicted permease